VLGPLDPSELTPALERGFELTVYDPGRLEELDSLAQGLRTQAHVHLKVETGTWRQGVSGEEFQECLRILSESEALRLSGLHSHYANIEDTTDHSYADAQYQAFQEAAVQVEARGLHPARVHMSCSAAAILFPSRLMELARVGISSYGYWPSSPTRISARREGHDELDLAPALGWKAKVAQVKRVPQGAFIGYGCSDKAEVETRLAVLPVGYADGYDRGIGGRGHVLLHGRRCPLRGRICMNLMMVDVSHLPQVAVGDEAVLLGRQGEEEISAETLATWADTIHYEVLARLSPLIPRFAV
jgi:alanine racemase